MKIDGGCHCGYITYEAEADPGRTSICHCTDCQTLSGSAFRLSIPALEGTFKLTGGEPAVYVKTAESGSKRAQGFCPRCGTSIYATSVVDGPKIYTVHAGRIYIFASEQCKAGFLKGPDKLLERDDSPPQGDDAAKKRGRELIELAVTAAGGAAKLDRLRTFRQAIEKREESGGKQYDKT